MSTRRNEMDMTHGPLAKKILLFALPLAMSSILQQLFNAVDLAVVGRFTNAQAMAAVGSNSSVIGLLFVQCCDSVCCQQLWRGLYCRHDSGTKL